MLKALWKAFIDIDNDEKSSLFCSEKPYPIQE